MAKNAYKTLCVAHKKKQKQIVEGQQYWNKQIYWFFIVN